MRKKLTPASEYGSSLPDGTPADIAILAGIGDVCLQWARLEIVILGVIAALEDQTTDETWLRYSGLDLLPRIALGIRLSEQKGYPVRFAKSLRSIRSELQGKEGLATKRNEIVHGAHKNLDGESATLTMTRYPEGRREVTIDPFGLNRIARQIHELGDKSFALMQEVGTWKIQQALKLGD
ncbi:MAG: hypothetical protein JJ901_15635 [Erythrobacter sp.]|uniref:hypothetical protein n=1 Tax=Erythrobacter sp. TaxID=1042 RepID=UPI001B0C1479|nr:hypothetical protein [Erythrobacter sp.]MBO6769724.1 hypothetical protein [Erythrobacter sp.]